MFYDLDLLCRQRKGKFSIIWLAATQGVRNLRKNDLERVNLSHTSQEILEYVMSNSQSPRKRLSLYLSAQLIYGLILVYREQVHNFKLQVIYISYCVQKPLPVKDDDKPRKSSKKSKKGAKGNVPLSLDSLEQQQQLVVQQIENEMLRNLVDINANITNDIHITIREDVGTTILRDQELFGDEGQIDQQLAMMVNNWDIGDTKVVPAPHPETSIPDPNIPEQIMQSPIIGTKKDQNMLLVSKLQEVEESPRKRKRVPTELTNEEMLQNMVTTQETRPPDIPVPRKRRRLQKKHINIIIDSPSKRKSTKINRNDTDEVREISLINTPPRQEDPKEILAALFAGISFKDEDIISVIRDVTVNQSLESPIIELPVVQEQHTRTFIEPTSISTVEEIPEVQTSHVKDSLLMISQNLSRIEIPQELEESHVIPMPRLEISSKLEERVQTSTPNMFNTDLRRQEKLTKKLRKIFKNNSNKPIKLEDVCQPLSRRNVSSTFNDLLSLQMRKLVVMVSFQDSTELQYIYSGEAL